MLPLLVGLCFGLLSGQSSFALDCSDSFSRKCYPHWRDVDRDGQNTRHEILIRDSLVPPLLNSKQRPVSGLWCCPYTAFCSTNPRDFDIDHLLSLSEIHKIGGADLDYSDRVAIANDPRNLLAVHFRANRVKSGFNSFDYVPPNLSFLGTYLRKREEVREAYGLDYQACEKESVELGLYLSSKVEYGLRLYRARSLISNSNSFVEKFLRQRFERCVKDA